MTATTIKMGRGLELPLAVTTMAGLIVGQRGTGKSSTCAREVEQADDAGIPSVVIDPTGVWWGLRHGKRPTSHVLMGGFLGATPDLPFGEGDGVELARLVANERLKVVLGLRHLRKGAQVRFMAEFAEELYHVNTAPLLVVVDEAHRFAPAQLRDTGGYNARCLGALVDIVGLGRASGLGVRLVTQRPVKVHADAREQCELVYVHRLMGGNDRNTIKSWLDDVGEPDQQDAARALLRRIPKLTTGHAVVYAPSLDLMGEYAIGVKRSYDSWATPEGAEVKAEPKGRQQIDLGAVRERLEAAVAEAKANDPKALRKRVTELERELANRPDAEPERVEVPVWPFTGEELDAAIEYAEGALLRTREVSEAAEELVRDAVNANAGVEGIRKALAGWKAAHDESGDAVDRVIKVGLGHMASGGRPPAPASRPPRAPSAPSAASNGTGEGVRLGKAHRAVLTVLAQRGPRTKKQVAMETGYSADGGGFNNALSALRSAGYITPGEPIEATQEGLAALGPVDLLPTGAELLSHWMGHARVGAAGRGVLAVLARSRGPLPKDELAGAAGLEVRGEPYAADGGGFNNALSALRTLGLVTRPPADPDLTPEFAEAIGR